MVGVQGVQGEQGIQLSVLALSSRFDGHAIQKIAEGKKKIFQYSLCRVVLMVFQRQQSGLRPAFLLSVLALSSRFDGPAGRYPTCNNRRTFSTRSVESF